MSSPDRVVISVLNSIGPTSSPFNEYVLYRLRRYPDERPVVITLLENASDAVELCRSGPFAVRLELLECHGSATKLVRTLHHRLAQSRSDERPTLVHVHHAAAGALTRWVKVAPWLPKIPTVHTMHTAFDRLSHRNRVLAAWALAGADQVVFVSEASRDAVPFEVRRRFRVEPIVIRNGVDLERVDAVLQQQHAWVPAGEAVAAGAAFSMITVGRLINLKNQALLLRVLADLPAGMTLKIIGGGPLEAQLRAQVKAMGLESRVELTGVVPREEVFRSMQHADLFVSSSHWEGLPVAVLEAMACELPVLLSDIPSHREVAIDGGAVTLLPHRVDAWVRALRNMAARPATERRREGRLNRIAVQDRFSLDSMQDAYRDVYRRLWTDRSPVGA